MSGVLGYVLGYELVVPTRRSRAKRREIVDAIFYGHRPVQVDQSYLDQPLDAPSAAQRLRSDHNFDAAAAFGTKRFNGKRSRAARSAGCPGSARPEVAALQAQLAERDAALAQAQAACAAERAVHQTTHEEKWGLDLFRLMATWLINAHIAGRSDRPHSPNCATWPRTSPTRSSAANLSAATATSRRNKARLDRVVDALDRP